MEWIVRLSWAGLAALHVMPAAVLFSPSLVSSLYRVEPTGDLGVLLVHRGALFLAVVAASIYAAFDPSARRIASLVVAISMLGFLLVYVRSGMPAGGLAKIARADLVGLAPLLLVGWNAWR